jgi:uncharacterized protein
MKTSGLRSVMMALALQIAAAAPVPAQQASFDCLQAQQPIETLICSDPQLIELDGALEAAFLTHRQRLAAKQREAALQEQRAWLAERLSRCGVPAQGGEVGQEVRWRAAPCLDAMYRERLAKLGAAQTPPPVLPAMAAQPGFIHPACLWGLIEQEAEPADDGAKVEKARIPLAACARGNRHIPVEQDEDRGLLASGASDGFPTWLSYRFVGILPDGREVAIIWYNAGGSGQFSELYLFRRTPTPDRSDVLLEGEPIAGGGDRCNGAITEASLVDPGTLEIDYAVTPLDLLSEADEELADAHMDSLSLCAVCCTGSVRRRLAIASKTETTVSATVERLLSRDATEDALDYTDEPKQICFDDILAKAAGTLPHTFPPAELKAIAQSFAKTCVSAPTGGAARPAR